MCIIALDNAIIGLKKKFGFAKNESVLSRPAIDGIVAHVVEAGSAGIDNADVTVKDYVAVINKIKKSVLRHSASGPRAYFDFIRHYV